MSRTQFSLITLFEYTTLCCFLAALIPLLGITSAICLALFSMALAARHGGLALTLLVAASLSAGLPVIPGTGSPMIQQTIMILAASLIGAWYRWRALTYG